MNVFAPLPDGREARLLPLERVKVCLRLKEAANFTFLHGRVLERLLRRVCPGEELPAGLFPQALESGHVRYAAGDAYSFVVGAAAECRPLLRLLNKALRQIGRERRWGIGPAELEGNFEVEKVEALPALALATALERAEAFAAKGEVRLLFHAPLHLARPAELRQPGAPCLTEDCFPVGCFLSHLWQRYVELCGDEGSSLPAALPPRDSVKIRVERLHWLDLPARFSSGKALGGVCGSIVCEGLPLSWLRLLLLLEGVPLGSDTQFGFGFFALESLPEWLRPARTFEERLGPDATSPRAAVDILAPAAMALLDDGSAYARRYLSRQSADGGLRRAKEQGLNGSVGGAGQRFVARLGEEEVLARLEALWPGEPLVQRVREWLGVPADRADLTRLLGKIFAAELADAVEREGRRLVRIGCELRVFGRQAARVA